MAHTENSSGSEKALEEKSLEKHLGLSLSSLPPLFFMLLLWVTKFLFSVVSGEAIRVRKCFKESRYSGTSVHNHDFGNNDHICVRVEKMAVVCKQKQNFARHLMFANQIVCNKNYL